MLNCQKVSQDVEVQKERKIRQGQAGTRKEERLSNWFGAMTISCLSLTLIILYICAAANINL